MTECELKPAVAPDSNMMVDTAAADMKQQDEIDNNNKPDKPVLRTAAVSNKAKAAVAMVPAAPSSSESEKSGTTQQHNVPVSETCTTATTTSSTIPSSSVTAAVTSSTNNKVSVSRQQPYVNNVVSTVNAMHPSNSCVSVQTTAVKDLTIPTPQLSGKSVESLPSSNKNESLSRDNNKNNQESQSPRKQQLSNKPESVKALVSSGPRSVPATTVATANSSSSSPLKLTPSPNAKRTAMALANSVVSSTIPSTISLPGSSSGLSSGPHIIGKAPLPLSSLGSVATTTTTPLQLATQFVDKSAAVVAAPQQISLGGGGTTTVATANGELISMPTEFLQPHNGSGHMIITRAGHHHHAAVSSHAALVEAGSIGTAATHHHQIIVQDEANNVISIPEDSFPGLATLKLENGSKLQISPDALSPIIAAAGSGISISGGNVISIPEPAPVAATQLPTAPHPIKIEPTNGMTARPPNTELLLKTAKNMLQLNDDPIDQYKRVFPGSILEVDETGAILSTTTQDPEELTIHENVQEMEVDETGAYILGSVDGGEQLYSEDPNIMWIEETVEVEQEAMDGMSNNMVIILNPNGTVNEELMLANGFNLDTVKALTEAAHAEGVAVVTTEANMSTATSAPTVVTSTTPASAPAIPPSPAVLPPPPKSGGITSITSLQHPIPKKLLAGIEPIMNAALPSGVLQSVSNVLPATKHENPRSVILDPKEECMLLNDVKDPLLTQQGVTLQHHVAAGGQAAATAGGGQSLHGKIITINGQHHLITTSKPIPQLRRISGTQNIVTPLGTLDLRLPKKDDLLGHYVNPTALVPEQTVLKVLDQSELLKGKRGDGNGPPKVKRQRLKDENGNGTFINRKTTSLGALGQALHGIPSDSRENAVQICPICKFQATTKNPYRHLQDHLARVHFKERIAAELPTKKPYICPFDGCDGKAYPDWQAVMRHYIGKKHGILDKYVREHIAQTGIKLPDQYVRWQAAFLRGFRPGSLAWSWLSCLQSHLAICIRWRQRFERFFFLSFATPSHRIIERITDKIVTLKVA